MINLIFAINKNLVVEKNVNLFFLYRFVCLFIWFVALSVFNYVLFELSFSSWFSCFYHFIMFHSLFCFFFLFFFHSICLICLCLRLYFSSIYFFILLRGLFFLFICSACVFIWFNVFNFLSSLRSVSVCACVCEFFVFIFSFSIFLLLAFVPHLHLVEFGAEKKFWQSSNCNEATQTPEKKNVKFYILWSSFWFFLIYFFVDLKSNLALLSNKGHNV